MVRIGDVDSYGDELVVTPASTVFVNGQPAAVVGASTINGSVVVEGSDNVFVEGRPAVRLNDRTNTGSYMATTSPDVILNNEGASP